MHPYTTCNQYQLDDHLINACQAGDFAKVIYVLTSPHLRIHANVHDMDDYPLAWACSQGHLEIVKYLLTSPGLSEHAHIQALDNRALRWACSAGHLEVVKYLLTSADLLDHANVHACNDDPLKRACTLDSMDMVDFFISDMQIDFSPQTYQDIKETNRKFRQYLAHRVARREFFLQLHSSLPEPDGQTESKLRIKI